MKRLTLFILTITLTLLLMEATFVGQTFLSAFATTVKIDPASQQIPLPGTETVNVSIEDVANLGAFEFTLKYDGSIVKIVQATDVQLGDFLGNTGRTVVPTGPEIDNDAGEMTFGAFTFGDNPGPDGDGVLATIIFTAQSEGASALDLTDVQVTDINGDVIPIDVIDGQIQVGLPPTTIVKIDPESQQTTFPGTAEVNVKIENVTNLGAFEFTLKYNGSIVKIWQPTDVQLGDFLGSTGRTVVPTGPDIDNDAGEMTFGAFTFGENPGPDGDGVLATIILTAQSEGISALDLTDVQVTDINGDVIPIDVLDGQIQVGAPSTTIVKIDPESQQTPLPGTAEVNVKIEDVTNLGAFEFKLKYDGSIVKILQATDVQLGDFLGSTGRTVVPTGPDIDNDAGEMTFGAFTFGENPGPDGDGVLAIVTFTAQSEGASALDLTDVQVTDINGDVIPVDVIDGEVQVVGKECNPGDVSGNGTISAYDASLILQYTVGLIADFPVNKVGAPHYDTTPRNYTVWVPEQSAKSGEVIDVPIAIDDATGLLAGGISVKYDPTILKAVDVMAFPLLSGNYWQANIQLEGEVRVAFAGTTPLQGNGNLLNIKFEVLPQADGKTSPIIFSHVNLSNSLSITKRNGSVTILAPEFALLQNFPNPFNPETWLPYQLAMDADVVIHIHNMRGQLIRSIFVGWQTVGSYVTKDKSVYWDGRDNLGESVSSGVYFYTLQAGNFKTTRRMLLVK